MFSLGMLPTEFDAQGSGILSTGVTLSISINLGRLSYYAFSAGYSSCGWHLFALRVSTEREATGTEVIAFTFDLPVPCGREATMPVVVAGGLHRTSRMGVL